MEQSPEMTFKTSLETLQIIAEHVRKSGKEGNKDYADGLYMALDLILRQSDCPMLLCYECEEWFPRERSVDWDSSNCGCCDDTTEVVLPD